MKWFEKKWFVNLKVGTRQRLCFLIISIITAAVGAAAILIMLSAKVPNAQLYSTIIGGVCLLDIVLAFVLANINAFLVTDPMLKNDRMLERFSVGKNKLVYG
jgi:hypothetical protein